MIFGSRSTELPFEVEQRAVLPIHLFDFEFSKALQDRSVLYDRHVVERLWVASSNRLLGNAGAGARADVAADLAQGPS